MIDWLKKIIFLTLYDLTYLVSVLIYTLILFFTEKKIAYIESVFGKKSIAVFIYLTERNEVNKGWKRIICVLLYDISLFIMPFFALK